MQRYATIVTPAAIERLIKELQTSIDKYRCSWLQEKQEKQYNEQNQLPEIQNSTTVLQKNHRLSPRISYQPAAAMDHHAKREYRTSIREMIVTMLSTQTRRVAHTHCDKGRQEEPTQQEDIRPQEEHRLREETNKQDCKHHDWQKVIGINTRCQKYDRVQGSYLLECQKCHLRACVRCKRNTLSTEAREFS